MVEISIIIPCYNTPDELLTRCADSIRRQDFSDFEVIFVDDGSRPEYAKELREVCERDHRFRLITQTNQGVSAARNNGVRAAAGAYIAFVDSDDMLAPCFLSEAYCIAKEKNADFVIGGNVNLSRYRDEIGREPIDPSVIELLSGGERAKLKPYMLGDTLKFGDCGGYIGRGPWTRLVRREIAAAVPFDSDLAIGEDIVWNLRLIERCTTICLVKKIWYCYYHNTASATRKYNERAIEDALLELERMKVHLDFDRDDELAAYGNRILQDLRRIYQCYLGRTECGLDRQQKRRLVNSLYRDEPWNLVGTKRYLAAANKKDRWKSVLYRARLLFAFWAWKDK